MDKLQIVGGKRLNGEIAVSGAKNAALPILCAGLLTGGDVELSNVPRLHDVKTILRLLEQTGLTVTQDDENVTLNGANITSLEAPYELVKTMRASILVLGPLLRYVDETVATVWVEVARAARVTVRAGGLERTERTFAAHGHHYAVVDVEGLEPGSCTPYVVEVDGEQVWPEAGSPYPAPVLRTLDHARPLRMAFGSCRVSVSHDEEGNAAHGVDALRAMALALAGVAESHSIRTVRPCISAVCGTSWSWYA